MKSKPKYKPLCSFCCRFDKNRAYIAGTNGAVICNRCVYLSVEIFNSEFEMKMWRRKDIAK